MRLPRYNPAPLTPGSRWFLIACCGLAVAVCLALGLLPRPVLEWRVW